MNDTQILNNIRDMLRMYSEFQLVISPARAREWALEIDAERDDRREKSCTPKTGTHMSWCVSLLPPREGEVERCNCGLRQELTPQSVLVPQCGGCVVKQCGGGVVDQHTPATLTRDDTKYLTSNVSFYLQDDTYPEYTRFWRCNHHPIAISNWAEELDECEQGCCEMPRWFDNGMTT